MIILTGGCIYVGYLTMKEPQQNSRSHSRSHSGRRMVGLSHSEGMTTGTVASHRNQQATGSTYSQGSTPFAGRKSEMANDNHLLNFQYDPISHSQQRGPPPPPPARRQRKRRPYNKYWFLQANFKFMVLDSGNYFPESMDPDKMLQWEDIICVTYSTPSPTQCPICLEHPLCPQITSCGHIFCFPCILQYLLLGEEDHKGDNIEFTFLTRKKDSFTLSHKNKQETDNSSCGQRDVCDLFSKFRLTLDVYLSVRYAISDLDGWLARADSGLVDDLEKLPYVSAAMQQLKQRKKYWNEHKASNSEKSSSLIDYALQVPLISANVVDTDDENCSSESRTSSTDFPDQSKVIAMDKSTAGSCQDEILDLEKLLVEQEMNLSSSYEEKKCIQGHSNGIRDAKENDSYNFYQAVDGQHLILHPLNTKCLLHHYGSYDKLPHRISGRILQLETVTQSEAVRRRKELAKKELKEKLKAKATSNYALSMSTHSQLISRDDPPTFSIDEFEALGNSTLSSSPQVVGERKLFSSVTRFGFAAAHDSPSFQA
ncbi:hypothetical protein KIW84_022740 [Lathyrus oleraceus]|uniref:RING-type domain-containing protein n=1 Tax=Pisum sativum TaxID=3888 RepID=A0A9D4YB82_PEA|nr:hypothetical protein KIW84_022740 [Pisum sativum]